MASGAQRAQAGSTLAVADLAFEVVRCTRVWIGSFLYLGYGLIEVCLQPLRLRDRSIDDIARCADAGFWLRLVNGLVYDEPRYSSSAVVTEAIR